MKLWSLGVMGYWTENRAGNPLFKWLGSVQSKVPRGLARHTPGGFTLLEVMVSLAIIATAFTAVLRLHADSIGMVISSRVHTKAAELAQLKMTEIEILGLENIQKTRGNFQEYAPEYTWKIDLEAAPVPAWVKVSVTVSYRRMGDFQLVEYLPVIQERKDKQ